MPISVSQLQDEPPPSPEEQWRVASELLLQLEEKNKNVYKWRNLLTHASIFEERAAIADLKESDLTDFQAISASKLTLSNSF